MRWVNVPRQSGVLQCLHQIACRTAPPRQLGCQNSVDLACLTAQAQKVSLPALNGLQFDLSAPHGKLIASVTFFLAEFERDLLSERVKSGLAAARARGRVLGRQNGFRPKSDRLVPKVLKLVGEGRSCRDISHQLKIDKNTRSSASCSGHELRAGVDQAAGPFRMDGSFLLTQ